MSAALKVVQSLDDVVIKVSIGIGRNVAEAEEALGYAKRKKSEGKYYNIESYHGDPLPPPDMERTRVVESFLRLEQKLLLEGFDESLTDLNMLKYDPKTGLLNRTGYEVEVQKLRNRYAYDDRVIILIDGDDMKKANSTLGYDGTDRYLEAIGRALKGQVRQNVFSRDGVREPDVLVNRKNDSGGDEFIVDVQCPYNEARKIAMRCVDAMYAAQRELGPDGG
ncbi:diguanylate cyclase [Candidatus Woesearchaeota archaeon]|nr:diguanylate cyclase [Candidatus Woesearchaeota archaeon]